MAKRGHTYRITVEPIAHPRGEELRPPFVFEATNHDDIIGIAQRVQAKGYLEPEDAAAVIIGMKLLSEVMIMRKNDPLFEPLKSGAMSAFVANIKGMKSPGEAEAAADTAPAPAE